MGGVGVWLHSFLTLVQDVGEWSTSRSSHFIPGKELPVTIEKEAGWAPENNLKFHQFKIECDLYNTC